MGTDPQLQARADELRRKQRANELRAKRDATGTRQIGPGSDLESQPRTVGNTLSRAASNLLPSLGRLIKDVTAPVHSPIDTTKGLYGLASGLVQMVIPGEQANEQKVREVGKYFGDRYGGMENILKTFEEDPAGLAADVASLFASGGALTAVKGGTKACLLYTSPSPRDS